MKNLNLELIEVITHCCDVKTFRFGLPKEVDFKPGFSQHKYCTRDPDIDAEFIASVTDRTDSSISNSPPPRTTHRTPISNAAARNDTKLVIKRDSSAVTVISGNELLYAVES